MWGMGVTSRIRVTRKPACCRALSALSRPAPGPFTNTATERIPCEPLNPRDPELAHEMVFPVTSEIVTIVLLKVDLMWAIPVGMFFFAAFFVVRFFVAMTWVSYASYSRRAQSRGGSVAGAQRLRLMTPLRGPFRVREFVWVR